MAPFFRSCLALPLRSRGRTRREDGFVGKLPRGLWPSCRAFRIWLLFALLALWESGPSTFAVPNNGKQPSLHLQRQKEGLDVYQSAGAEFYDAINLPGVRIEPTKEEHRLASKIKARGNGEPGQWSQVQQILSEYSGYSPLVLNAAMKAALNSRMYLEGARFFERLRRTNAPITLPVYPTALKLFGKLHEEGQVRNLWEELVHFEAVNHVVAQACIDAYADNGYITGAAEVLEYMENSTIQMNARHFTSAINACANSNENYRARAAKYLLEKLLERGLQPSIITYSCVVRSMQQSEGQELLDVVSNMTAQGVKANNVFAENFFYQFLKQSKKGSWTSKAAVVADLRNRKLPRVNLKRAQDVMNEFLAAGVKLNASCRRIKAALESLL